MQFEEFVGINVKILNPEPICNNGRNEIMAHEAVKYLKSWFAWNYLTQLAALFSHLFKKKKHFQIGVIRLSKRMTLDDLFINFCFFAVMTGLVWSLDRFQTLSSLLRNVNVRRSNAHFWVWKPVITKHWETRQSSWIHSSEVKGQGCGLSDDDEEIKPETDHRQERDAMLQVDR